MRQRHDHTRDLGRHTASQLAEMGYCERKVLLKHRYGTRVAPSRSLMQQRGTTEHERFLEEAARQDPRVISDRQPCTTRKPAASMTNAIRSALASIAAFLHFTGRRRK
jgi:hypothetical protein